MLSWKALISDCICTDFYSEKYIVFVISHSINKNIYCISDHFRVFRFLRICDFGTFREVLNSRIINFNESSVIIIIIFATFLNLRICPSREIRENLKVANITRYT